MSRYGRFTRRRSTRAQQRSRFMNSRFSGTCAQTGKVFGVAARIMWDCQSRLAFSAESPLVSEISKTIFACNDGRPGTPATEDYYIKNGVAAWLREHTPVTTGPAGYAPGTPHTVTARFSSGATVTQNARGRCEDAPCCGCCS